MSKILQSQSTLTDRFQTTIPEPVRRSLHLTKRDKIAFTIEDDGKVTLSKANEDDPVIGQFLAFLANDLQNNPKQIKSINTALIERAQNLVAGVKIDLDAPLNDKDE